MLWTAPPRGTRVPKSGGRLRLHDAQEQPVSQIRQSVSILPSRSFKGMALMRRAKWSYAAVEAAVRLGIFSESWRHGGLGVSIPEAVAFGRWRSALLI
jgi:hypothetical protein